MIHIEIFAFVIDHFDRRPVVERFRGHEDQRREKMKKEPTETGGHRMRHRRSIVEVRDDHRVHWKKKGRSEANRVEKLASPLTDDENVHREGEQKIFGDQRNDGRGRR